MERSFLQKLQFTIESNKLDIRWVNNIYRGSLPVLVKYWISAVISTFIFSVPSIRVEDYQSKSLRTKSRTTQVIETFYALVEMRIYNAVSSFSSFFVRCLFKSRTGVITRRDSFKIWILLETTFKKNWCLYKSMKTTRNFHQIPVILIPGLFLKLTNNFNTGKNNIQQLAGKQYCYLPGFWKITPMNHRDKFCSLKSKTVTKLFFEKFIIL